MAPRTVKPARRRAKQARAQASVAAILEAAARVLLRRGYAGATTNRIAESAGVSVGTLYQYFADKDAVYDALIRRETDALGSALDAIDHQAHEPLDASLRRIFRAALAAMPHGPELSRRLEQVPNALLRRRVAEGKHRVIALVRDLLEAHRAELRVDDLDLAAFVIVNASQGVGLEAGPELFGERLAEELTALFTRYLLRAP